MEQAQGFWRDNIRWSVVVDCVYVGKYVMCSDVVESKHKQTQFTHPNLFAQQFTHLLQKNAFKVEGALLFFLPIKLFLPLHHWSCDT